MTTSRAVTFTALSPKHYILVKDAEVVYEPSAFSEVGSEVRKNIVLRVADRDRTDLSTLEQSIVQGAGVCSVVKDDCIKVKMDVEECRIFDQDHNRINSPERWKGLRVHLLVEVKGSWKSKTASGLSCLAIDIQILKDHPPPTSPFKFLDE
jgi:hypothetical protein